MLKNAMFASALAGLALTMTPTAHAKKCEGVSMPNKTTVEGTELVLNGMGVREATVFSVNVYVAGLYLESKTKKPSEITSKDKKKVLVMKMVREIERDKLGDALKKAFGSKHAAEVRKLKRWLPADLKEGLKIAFIYVPGKGTEVKINGRSKGTLEGAGFQKDFFNIFVGSKPPNKGLKKGLLGGKCG